MKFQVALQSPAKKVILLSHSGTSIPSQEPTTIRIILSVKRPGGANIIHFDQVYSKGLNPNDFAQQWIQIGNLGKGQYELKIELAKSSVAVYWLDYVELADFDKSSQWHLQYLELNHDPSYNTIPISSVTGFSRPAAHTVAQDAVLYVLPSQRSELVRLLMSGPGTGYSTTPSISYAGWAAAAASTTNAVAMMKIHLWGLINFGNMCFANSVLQIMVYCLPFHQLFAKLGRVADRMGAKIGDRVEGLKSRYLLVKATVEFLREFVVDDKLRDSKDSKEQGQTNVTANRKVASTSASVSPLTSGSSAPSSSFLILPPLPTLTESAISHSLPLLCKFNDLLDGKKLFLLMYLYDAMKVKKRFEHMQVSVFFLSFVSHFIFLSFPF